MTADTSFAPVRFRKRPVVVEAMRFTAETCRAVHEWVGDDHDGGLPADDPDNDCSQHLIEYDIPTREGRMTAEDGDWIIKGVEGEFYPCKPSIFEATYERVV
jgi:hypothetical protein